MATAYFEQPESYEAFLVEPDAHWTVLEYL